MGVWDEGRHGGWARGGQDSGSQVRIFGQHESKINGILLNYLTFEEFLVNAALIFIFS